MTFNKTKTALSKVKSSNKCSRKISWKLGDTIWTRSQGKRARQKDKTFGQGGR